REDETRAGTGFLEELWRRLLGRSAASAETSFFDLGGDSLLAIQLLAELRVRTGRQITTRQFAADPTLRGLRALLPAEAPAAPPSPPEPRDPLSRPSRELAPVEAETDAALDGAERDEDSVHAFLAQYLHRVRQRAVHMPLDSRVQFHDWHV